MSSDVAVARVALIGNYVPRRCGIATFTADLRNALLQERSGLECSVTAMNDGKERYAYPPAVDYEIRQVVHSEYLAAADHINATNPDVVCLQHEYGIFGGEAGEYALSLIRRLRVPLVSTFHTVLSEPSRRQRKVFDGIVEKSARIVVMTEFGREMLIDRFGVPAAKVCVIPHGIPDMPFLDPAFCKGQFDLDQHEVLLTFGLLSRNKGIELAIKALPDVIRSHPNVMYVVLGATHPHVLAEEGEAYRGELEALAKSLGVARHVRFINEFAELQVVLDYLTAADVYVTPYCSAEQVTSGTLAYSVGLGKAVVSTPYWHAKEMLAEGRGELVPFGDAAAVAAKLNELLENECRRNSLRRHAYAEGRRMTWPAVAQKYLAVFAEARRSETDNIIRLPQAIKADPRSPQPSLVAVSRMTDNCGMLQHGVSNIPNRAHGYCLDDNARALLLTHDLKDAGLADPRIDEFAIIYASFVDAAWNSGLGKFRNFMSFGRSWLEDAGSEDSFGRALWAIGATAARTLDHGTKLWAENLANSVIAHADFIESPRASAFMTLGLVDYLRVFPGHRGAQACLRRCVLRLQALFRQRPNADWCWFEPTLAYDNARLPEALLRAGGYLDDAELSADGLLSLRWLMKIQTAPAGHFRPTGTESFGKEFSAPNAFDQQPVDVWASISACEAAYDLTSDAFWTSEAARAFAWFGGANDLGIRMAAPGGGCFDGLQVDRVNFNQGAESILAYQFSVCANLRLQRLADVAPPLAVAEAR